MENLRSQKQKAADHNLSTNGDKKTQENSVNVVENMFLSLLVYRWFGQKRKPQRKVDGDRYGVDDGDFASMPRDLHPPTNSLHQVSDGETGDNHIHTRRRGPRPSLLLPYNQPATFEGAKLTALDEIMHPTRAEARRAAGTNLYRSFSDGILSPLSGAVMDEDNIYPSADLVNVPSYPLRHTSMVCHGQLPPLCCAVSAPTLLFTTGSNSEADNSPVQPSFQSSVRLTPTQDALQNTEQDEELASTEQVYSESNKTEQKMFAVRMRGKKKQSSKTDDICITDMTPTVKECPKQQEKKRKAEEKQQKEKLKKEMKKQKEVEKKNAKESKKKVAEKRKEEKEMKKAEKEANKVKKAAEKEEKAAAKAETKKNKKQIKLEVRLQKTLDKSDRQMAADLQKRERFLLEQERKREKKATRIKKKNAKTDKTIVKLLQKIDRKERKVVQLQSLRDISRSKFLFCKRDYEIETLQRQISRIKRVVAKLESKVGAIDTLTPLLATEVSTEELDDDFRPISPIRPAAQPHLEVEVVDMDDDVCFLDMLVGINSNTEVSDDEVEAVLQQIQETLDQAEQNKEGPSHFNKGQGPTNIN